jgi:antitoxin YefM
MDQIRILIRKRCRMSHPIRVSDGIVPVGEFKAHASKLIRAMRESRRPIVITQNGRPAAVVMLPEEYDELTERRRFVAAVDAGLDDARAGRLVEDDDLDRELDEAGSAR